MATVAQFAANRPPSEQEEDKNQLGAPGAPSGGGGAAPVDPVGQGGAPQGPAQPGQQGSGRFTNINKYIAANQGAGKEIGQRIGQGINKSLDVSAKGATTEADAFRAGVDKANQSNVAGQQILGQVQDTTGAGIQALTSNQDAIKNYVNYRSGNEAAAQGQQLAQTQAASDMAAQKAAADLAKRQQQLSTEQNRGGLLSEFFGSQGGGYTKGAQRLDQAFLQRDKNQSINAINQNLKAQEAGRFKAIADTQKALADQASTAAETAGKLTGDISTAQNQAITNQQAALKAQMDQVAAQRQAQIDRFNLNTGALLDEDVNTTIQDDWLKEMGLQAGQRTYGALTNLSKGDIGTAALSGDMGLNYGNTATDPQLAQWNALQRLAGSQIVDDQLQYDPSAELKRGTLDAAVTYNQGNQSLAGRVNDARSRFEQAVGQAGPFTGTANWGGSFAYEQQALQDYLAGNNAAIQRGHSEASFGGTPFNGGGVSMENVQQAEALAAQQRINQINDWLRSQSYDETLESGGRARGNLTPDASYQNLGTNTFKVK